MPKGENIMAEWTSNHVKAIDIGEAVDLGTMEPKYTTNTSVVFQKKWFIQSHSR